MTLLFQNRLSGKTTTIPDKKAYLGQWICIDSHRSVSLNRNCLQDNDFLIPNTNSQWVISGHSENLNGTFSPHNLPDQIETSSIRTIGVELESLHNSKGTFSEWIKQSPIVPQISEAIELKPFDAVIEEHICHLELICSKPRAHLWTEIELVPASKARRIPRRSLDYLASHTEDWERPTLRNVQPKNILSFISDDLWDIYENRVAVRLTDHLNHYLNNRSYELNKAFQLFSKADFLNSTITGTRRRRDRIFKLWGEHFDESEGYLRAEETMKKIESLRYRILRLKNSFLYRSVPRQMMVSNTLKMTNIFSNDQHYRHVAILWREWSKCGAVHIETPIQIYQKYQDLCHGFNRFCMLLVLRALEQLRFSPPDPDQLITETSTIKFRDTFGEVILDWEEDGSVTFRKRDEELLRIVPMPFSPGDNPKTIQNQFDCIADNKPEARNSFTLLLAISGPEDQFRNFPKELLQNFNNVGNAPSPLSKENIGVILVSPWEIESVERVARALRWVLTGAEFLKYPPKIRKPKFETTDEIEMRNTGWLNADDGNYYLTRIPQEKEKSQILITKNEELPRVKKSKTAEVNNLDRNSQKRKNLNRELSQIESDLNELKTFSKALSHSIGYMEALKECPVCNSSISNFRSDNNEIFSCVCTECNAEWGIRFCDNCCKRFPFLLPPDFTPDKMDVQNFISNDWIDRVVGCDIMSIPVSASQYSFICPNCFSITKKEWTGSNVEHSLAK